MLAQKLKQASKNKNKQSNVRSIFFMQTDGFYAGFFSSHRVIAKRDDQKYRSYGLKQIDQVNWLKMTIRIAMILMIKSKFKVKRGKRVMVRLRAKMFENSQLEYHSYKGS